MALERMLRVGDKVRIPTSGDILVVDHFNGGIAICKYVDGRLQHGVPATTSFIAQFHDGSLNTYVEHFEENDV